MLRVGLDDSLCNSMKPLARWTYGYSSFLGLEVLRHSVKRFSIIYPEFDQVICYNNLKDGQLYKLQSIGVPLHKQVEEDLGYPLTPADSPPGWKWSMAGWGWKLVPPRLRPETHELWIDNDMVIRNRLSSIDKWLQSKTTLICQGLQRAYGCLDKYIDQDKIYCAGMMGVPPHYDFKQHLLNHCEKLEGNTLGYYDEQGVVVLSLMPDTIVVPLHEIDIVKRLERPYSDGLHFVGVNRTDWHIWWETYKCCMLI